MKDVIKAIIVLFFLGYFSTLFAEERAKPAETVKTEKDILGILLSSVPESEFDKIVEAIEGMSEQEKSYYSAEYKKIKAQYKLDWAQQKSAWKIQSKFEEMTDEALKKAEAGPELKKGKAGAQKELKKLTAEKRIEDYKSGEEVSAKPTKGILGHGQTQETKKKYKYQQWQFLHEEKCSKCHTLERVFAEPKTEDEWRNCVTRMMQMSPLWITPEESEHIIDEIIKTKEGVIASAPQKKRYSDAQILFVDRCTKCHPVGRILRQDKTGEEWEETVMRMRDNAPELFFDEDIPVIVDYLTERGKIMKDDVGAEMVVKKCLICHEWGRILLERKSKREWEECVREMRALTRKTLKKDWFTHDDFKIIVDLLVKTQGISG